MDRLVRTMRYALTDSGECGTLQVVNGYAICPRCGQKKIAQVYPDSFISHVGVWCRVCGNLNISIYPER